MAFFALNELNLTEAQLATIDSIYDTFIPPIDGEDEKEYIEKTIEAIAPGQVERHEAMRNFFKLPGHRSSATILKLLSNGNMITPSDLTELLFAINLLSTSWGTFVLTGYYKPFSSLDQQQREGVFKSFMTSYFVQKRLLANTFRAIFLLVWCSDVTNPTPIDLTDPFKMSGHSPHLTSPIWAAVNYPGPNPNYHPTSPKWGELRSKNRIWTLPSFDLLKQYSTTPIKMQYGTYKELLTAMANSSSTLLPLPLPTQGEVQYDAVIVGSGAGAGPVTLQLSQAGYRVLVIEQGTYHHPDSINGLEAEAFEKNYLNGACLTTTDKTMTVLAGAGFGGGTAINWSASLDTPHYVREEWADEFGLKFMTTSAFTTCLERIKSIMQVHPHPEGCHNGPNSALFNGSAKLGYASKTLNQNGIDEHHCGWCFAGCKHQQKQGTNISFIPIAMNRYGAHVITDTRVEQVLFDSIPHWTSKHQDAIKKANETFKPSQAIKFAQVDLSDRFQQGDDLSHEAQLVNESTVSGSFIPQTKFDSSRRVATGVLVSYRDPETKKLIPLKINAKIVVCSAGALQTPLLLKRSGINHPQLGQNLRLHPVIGLGAIYPNQIDSWNGTQMTSICTAYQNQYKNYGAIIETPNAHLGLLAGALPWWGGRNFKELALRLDHLAAFICLTREMTSSGSVWDREGKVQIDYNFTQLDRNHLLETLLAAMKIHVEAGAVEIITPFPGIPSFKPDPILLSSDPKFIEYLQVIKKHHIVDNSVQVLSAHQMGTARMSSDPRLGPTDQTGEVFNVANLFVADASVFPTASGVNPMLSIMAMAQYISLNVQSRLERLQHIQDELATQGLSLYDYTATPSKQKSD